ncbi:MAG: hypothetical protein U0230_19575 [Polyangiales bacterium]
MTQRLIVLCLLFVGAGCAGSSTPSSGTTPGRGGASTSQGDLAERPVVGDLCMASYGVESDVTIIAMDLGDVGVLGVPALGDRWDIDCRPQGNQLVMASHGSPDRFVSVVVDPGVREMPDLARYAAEHVAASRQTMEANGVEDLRMGEPSLVDAKTYVVPMEGSSRGRHFAQLSVYSLVPSSIGLLRYHISEIADDGRVLNDSAPRLIAAAQAFNRLSP